MQASHVLEKVKVLFDSPEDMKKKLERHHYSNVWSSNDEKLIFYKKSVPLSIIPAFELAVEGVYFNPSTKACGWAWIPSEDMGIEVFDLWSQLQQGGFSTRKEAVEYAGLCLKEFFDPVDVSSIKAFYPSVFLLPDASVNFVKLNKSWSVLDSEKMQPVIDGCFATRYKAVEALFAESQKNS